jgi:hypothetical protein
MSLLLIEGWDGIGAITDKYAITGTVAFDTNIKRTGTRSVKIGKNNIWWLTYYITRK